MISLRLIVRLGFPIGFYEGMVYTGDSCVTELDTCLQCNPQHQCVQPRATSMTPLILLCNAPEAPVEGGNDRGLAWIDDAGLVAMRVQIVWQSSKQFHSSRAFLHEC